MLVDVQNTLVANALLRWASQPLQERVLSRLARGSVGAYALSEANAGSDAFALEARAVKDGDDYVLTGRKLWITNAGEAEIFLVMANANPEAGYSGTSAASRSERRKTSWESGPARPANSSSTTSESPGPTWWETWARATRSRSKR